MNFFEQQAKTKRQSRRLVFVFSLAVIAIVLLVDLIVAVVVTQFLPAFSTGLNSVELGKMNPFSLEWLMANKGMMIASSVITTGFIGASSLYKTVRLSFGGSVVAKDMGGTIVTADATDPLRKRLYNVVEEMAIASGVPMPEVYVLEQEAAINAFAAGSNPANAVVAVTRGTLENLDRDELQGVIAHEFSHILNGDMRLNIRIMGVLFGILIISLIGRTILRGMRHGRIRSNSREGGGAIAAIMLVGVGLTVIGWLGLTIGRMIKAAVSRQREYLADASAVQFTRQTDGIKHALMKIGIHSHSSVLKQRDSEEVNHMLFSKGQMSLSSMLATHPPLNDRLLAIDPHYKESELVALKEKMVKNAQRILEKAKKELEQEEKKRQANFESNTALDNSIGKALGGLGILLPGVLGQTVGNPAVQHVTYAELLRSNMPKDLIEAAHDSNDDVLHLTLALLLHPDIIQRAKQLQLLNQQMGEDRTEEIKHFFEQVQKIGDAFRLPLLDLAFPALKRRPNDQLDFLRAQIDKIITTDNKVEPFEYALSRVLASHLTDVWQPYAEPKKLRSIDDVKVALQHIFAVMSLEGSHDNQENAEAYQAGIEYLAEHPNSKKLLKRIKLDDLKVYKKPGDDWIHEMDEALLGFDRLDLKVKRALIEALSVTIGYDEEVSQTESELLRAVCSTLHCPLPPILQATQTRPHQFAA